MKKLNLVLTLGLLTAALPSFTVATGDVAVADPHGLVSNSDAIPLPAFAPAIPDVDGVPDVNSFGLDTLQKVTDGPRCDNPGRQGSHSDTSWVKSDCTVPINDFDLNQVGIWYCPGQRCKFNGENRGMTEGENSGYREVFLRLKYRSSPGALASISYDWRCDFVYGNPKCGTPDQYDTKWTELYGEGADWNAFYKEPMYWGVQVFHSDEEGTE